MNLSLSLFDDEQEHWGAAPHGAEPVDEVAPAAPESVRPCATNEAEVVDEPESVCPSEPDDHHVLAFVAVCRHLGIEHPALTPQSVGTILSGDRTRTLPGRRAYDRAECARLANLILRGLESAAPRLTPERWREAGEAAYSYALCNRLAAVEREKGAVTTEDLMRVSGELNEQQGRAA